MLFSYSFLYDHFQSPSCFHLRFQVPFPLEVLRIRQPRVHYLDAVAAIRAIEVVVVFSAGAEFESECPSVVGCLLVKDCTHLQSFHGELSLAHCFAFGLVEC